MVTKKTVRKDTHSTVLDHVNNSSIKKWYIVQPVKKLNLNTSAYKDQNTVTHSLPFISDVEMEEKNTEVSRY
jgi:hypothetical protein